MIFLLYFWFKRIWCFQFEGTKWKLNICSNYDLFVRITLKALSMKMCGIYFKSNENCQTNRGGKKPYWFWALAFMMNCTLLMYFEIKINFQIMRLMWKAFRRNALRDEYIGRRHRNWWGNSRDFLKRKLFAINFFTLVRLFFIFSHDYESFFAWAHRKSAKREEVSSNIFYSSHQYSL